MIFPRSLLDAIGAWQNGWGEVQSRRKELASVLRAEVTVLPQIYRTVEVECYRKRFIHKGELADLLLSDEHYEGVASWTTDFAFAEQFKGLVREGAVSGAIFCHQPTPAEVIVNIGALWTSNDFIQAAEAYREAGGAHAKALFNFRHLQGEVVLEAPLRRSEIVALTGAASPFDDLCDLCGVPDDARGQLFSEIHKQFEPRYLSAEQTQRALLRTVEEFRAKFPQLAESAKRI